LQNARNKALETSRLRAIGSHQLYHERIGEERKKHWKYLKSLGTRCGESLGDQRPGKLGRHIPPGTFGTHGGAKFISDNVDATACLFLLKQILSFWPPSTKQAFLLFWGSIFRTRQISCWSQNISKTANDVYGSRPARGPAISSPANAYYTLLQLRRTYRWHDGCWSNGKFLVMNNQEVAD
jgi:hypothetical protein